MSMLGLGSIGPTHQNSQKSLKVVNVPKFYDLSVLLRAVMVLLENGICLCRFSKELLLKD